MTDNVVVAPATLQNQRFTLEQKPVFVGASYPRRIHVTGDTAVWSYGEDLTHANNVGEIADGSPKVISTGVWLLSQGSSNVLVEDCPHESSVDIAPPVEKSGRQNAKKK
jgi:hypothetical protein